MKRKREQREKPDFSKVEVTLPITVHRPLKSILAGAGYTLEGLFLLLLAGRGIAMDISHGAITSVLLTSLFMLLLGGWVLLDGLLFRLTVTEEGLLRIRTMLKERSFRAEELSWRLSTEPTSSLFALTLQDKDGKTVGILQENSPGFSQAMAWLLRERDRIARERRWDTFLNTPLLMPVHWEPEPENRTLTEAHPFSAITVRDAETESSSLLVFPDEGALRRLYPFPTVGSVLTDAEQLSVYTDGFRLADRVLLAQKDRFAMLTGAEWESFRVYAEEKRNRKAQ